MEEHSEYVGMSAYDIIQILSLKVLKMLVYLTSFIVDH